MEERKICPMCKRYYGLNDLYCEMCGVKLEREQASQQLNESVQDFRWDNGLGAVNYSDEIPDQSRNIVQQKPDDSEGEKGVGVLIAIVIVLTAILIIGFSVLVFMIYRSNNAGKNSAGNETEQSAGITEPLKTTVTTRKEIVTSTVKVTEEPTEPTTTREPVKTFIVISEACSWEEAQERCEEMGGHLAYVTCEEDMDAILAQLEGKDLKYVWLGGTSTINSDDEVETEWLNGESLDYVDDNGLWYGYEPSGKDWTDPNTPLEPYIMLWNVDGYWSFNDNSNRVLDFYKTYRIGYVCQIDS